MSSEKREKATAFDEVDDAWERQVLRNFFDGARLKTIPSHRRKRQAVLRWLAGRFVMGQRYPEKQVNDVIARHHPDFAALRRYLVDEGFMQRDHGVYWRIDGLPG